MKRTKGDGLRVHNQENVNKLRHGFIRTVGKFPDIDYKLATYYDALPELPN
ncbi:unnamed protein product, partial [marine sediment metagenome]